MNANTIVFSYEIREDTLWTIVSSLKTDSRIIGVILVGSGAKGFVDRYSDLDFCIVTDESSSLREVFEDWGDKLHQVLLVCLHQKVDKSSMNLLHIYVLDSFLEIDMGFLPLSSLKATKPLWKVLYDTSGEIEARMQASWQLQKSNPSISQARSEALNAAWYPVLHAAIAIQRGQYWRALYEVGQVRDLVIDLKAMRGDLVSKRWRDVDIMESQFREKLNRTHS